MLVPGARKYCTHESLWVPFHSEPSHRNVAIVAVTDRRPVELQSATPSF